MAEFSLFNRITPRDRAFLIHQLSLMISSGMPLSYGLNLVVQQTSNEKLRQAVRTMDKDIENGHPFSAAAARFPEIFDDVAIAMLKSGEASGQLNKVLDELSVRMQRDMEFTSKVRNALLYPAFVVGVMIVVGIILATIIVPRLSLLFEDASIQLPWATQVVIAVSNSILHYWFIYIFVITIAVLLLRQYLSTPEGRLAYYRFQTQIPVIKTLVVNTFLVRFTSVLGMLIRSGVPISESIQITGQSLSNRVWLQALQVVRQEVERGIPLSTAMARHDIFPKTLTQMIAVGEQTGKLDEVLANMEAFYNEQTNLSVKEITTLIEPTILVIVALAAGFVVVAVILPIYGLAEQF